MIVFGHDCVSWTYLKARKKPSGGGKRNNWALDKWVELVYFEDAVS